MIDPQWVSRLADFRPAWWLPGGHAQTLSAAFWKGPQPIEQGFARQITLPDGDALVALDDQPPQWKAGDPAILMMHGLGGSARNPFLVRVTAKLLQRGVRVFRLNLRGCGTGAGLARLPYNAGRSGDLKAAVAAVIEWCREPTRGIGFQPVMTWKADEVAESGNATSTLGSQSHNSGPLSPPIDMAFTNDITGGERVRVRGTTVKLTPPHPGPLPHSHDHSTAHTDCGGEGAERRTDEWTDGRQAGSLSQSPLTLFGMSLSANLLLKYLGEEGSHVPTEVHRAIAINPPIDLARSVRTLERPLNRGYDQHFVKALIDHVRQQSIHRPDFAALPDPLPRTLFDFDDRFTATHGGYPGAAAYYTAASAQTRIPHIHVPTLILTAADDPLVPVEMFHEQRVKWPESVQLAITRGGGHLGYVGRGHDDSDARWLDWRVCEFVTRG